MPYLQTFIASTSRFRSSVHAKVCGVIFATCGILVIALTTYFSYRHTVTASRSLEGKTATYARVLGRSAESAVAFEDHETAREAFGAISADPDVEAMAVYVSDGRLLEARGEIASFEGIVASGSAGVARVPGAIIASSPVVSREGARGLVVVQLSTAALERDRRSLAVAAGAASVVALLAAFGAAWLLARSLARRLGRLARSAARVAEGDTEGLVFADGSHDEIGVLGSAFGATVEHLRTLTRRVAQQATEEQLRLESLVDIRTRELGLRNRDMRTLLDHVSDGFVMVDAQGNTMGDRSAIVESWFGAMPTQLPAASLIDAIDPTATGWFDLAWSALIEGNLPACVAADQFPRQLRRAGRTFDLQVTPVCTSDDRVTSALLVIKDVTERIERERAEASQLDVLALLARALDDRSAFLEFLCEGDALIDSLSNGSETDLRDVKRAIHTLKGNAALIGVASVAELCHVIENRLAENDDAGPSPADIADLCARWTSATAKLSALFAKTAVGRFEVHRASFDSLVEAIDAGTNHVVLGRDARLLRLESLDGRLQYVGEQATVLAARLGKKISVITDGSGLRFESRTWSVFWSTFAHLVRNAVDHAIESPETRTAAGKPEAGSLTVRAYSIADQFVLDVADDGPGIDWAALAAAARKCGHEVTCEERLTDALFTDGISTATAVSQISGRGVGLAAVRAATRALGGEVQVTSESGRGATFRFVFPIDALGDAYDKANETTTLVPARAA